MTTDSLEYDISEVKTRPRLELRPIEMHQGRLTRESIIKCYEFELVREGTA